MKMKFALMFRCICSSLQKAKPYQFFKISFSSTWCLPPSPSPHETQYHNWLFISSWCLGSLGGWSGPDLHFLQKAAQLKACPDEMLRGSAQGKQGFAWDSDTEDSYQLPPLLCHAELQSQDATDTSLVPGRDYPAGLEALAHPFHQIQGRQSRSQREARSLGHCCLSLVPLFSGRQGLHTDSSSAD